MSKEQEPRYVTPTLESITLRAMYRIPLTDFNNIVTHLQRQLHPWIWKVIGHSIEFMCLAIPSQKDVDKEKYLTEEIKSLRAGAPFYFYVTAIEHHSDSIVVEVQCRPVMWYLIARYGETTFTENQIQEALLEGQVFIKRVMSGLMGKQIEPVSVYPIIARAEIKSRLLNLGLKEIVDKLNKAEEHIVQNDFPESLKSSRTAFEKMIDWQMRKRGLEKTDNYKNDLERLRSRGHLDPETTQLLQSYYRCLSNIGVHEKGTPPGIYEAQMGYGITLIMLDYFANKLS